MAYVPPFTGILNAARFPLLSNNQPRTIITPGLDNAIRTPQTYHGTEESSNHLTPQCLYCENVLPTAEGITSVGYLSLIPGIPGATDFDQAIVLRDLSENNFLFVPARGKNYIYDQIAATWQSISPITVAATSLITRAYVNGRTFICYESLGIFEYDQNANTFLAQPLVGVDAADIRGISSSNNYLLAFTDIALLWSNSGIDPFDFTPSLTTGAGTAVPQEIKGKIQAIAPVSGGFIIYTTINAVSATYTNNARSPFSFRETNNAGGVATYEQINQEQNAGVQYAWTTGGLQEITLQGAKSTSAEVNDYFAGKVHEWFDPVSKKLLRKNVLEEFAVKVSYISNRYLVLSYRPEGTGEYTYALVQDTILKRWGKLKTPHSDCFMLPKFVGSELSTYNDVGNVTYNSYGPSVYLAASNAQGAVATSKLSLGFLRADGSVYRAVVDYAKETPEYGVAIFGKFQLTRGKLITLQTLDLDGGYPNADLPTLPELDYTVHAQVTLDGKNLDHTEPMQVLSTGQLTSKWARRLTGVNAAIVVEGKFALNCYMLTVTADGRR